ncbi:MULTISPECIES: cobalt ECF transporter T component CbiQ [unclassified Candidatus Frackibacter]|uniref:cobalt ECF transporter T component CbiQ n=1 Tax=unclassified Candidatus Frackibacter TaxID=2648818 RepID=UPI000794F180|nr:MULTISPECIES: cobalt ECF transporter T component CbiQ [unclassified Candidatus Frackibacter]KXS37478.1 MAG: cobalt/nickel transport system permease protein [Candidatus Frackibacter sp. T328-2]SDC34474.1 cobalt/nickel transport system permease protein [Candidatus Frackibacter sp. WG11]SEM56810.1 cobalt/nickel transport system permease protein [Candidatus Frackibacter sp. WG12]SFL70472.1 cobalt/nickel transport system permease protein [Candidatus Frackibacter sp. WG13]
MFNEKFAMGSSWVHDLDPRLKIIMAILLAVITAVGNNILMLLQIFFLACFFLVSAKLDLKQVLKRLLVINTFIFFMWLFIPFTYPGDSLFQIGPLSASWAGIIYATKITIRSNTIMIAVISLLSTSTISSLMHAMKCLYVPEKLIYLFFFVYRYLYVISDEFNSLHNSMKVRGFKPETSLHCYKNYAYLVGMLIIKSYERSIRVYRAMLARGFKGKIYINDEFKVIPRDIVIFACTLACLSWFVILEQGIILM